MLRRLHNKHPNSTVAIIASGPSAVMAADCKCDISIGVNGAAVLGRRFDYFMCGDCTAHLKDWFTVDCANIRVIARIVATMDYLLYPAHKYPKLIRMAVPQHQQHSLRRLQPPVNPHLTFKYKWYRVGLLAPDMNFLMFTGTISCCAVQLAYLMGAKHINLYGCNFHHSKSSHYFYDARADQVGRIRNNQIVVMDNVLKEVRSRSIRVCIYGETRLTQYDEQIL